jgi:serine/threonine protein kinase
MSPNHFFYLQNAELFDPKNANILEYIAKSRESITLILIKQLMKELLLALSYMHLKGITHLELSHESIICDETKHNQ